MNAKFIQKGDSIDFIPSRDMDAGEIIQHGNLVGITKTPVKAGELGALAVSGIFAVAKNNGTVFPLGADVFWNADSNSADRKGLFIGTAVKAAGTEKDSVEVLLNSSSAQSKGTTAFKVFPNAKAYAVGDTIAELGDAVVSEPIPAEMTHKFIVRSNCPAAQNDVTIDWGDGSPITKLSDGISAQHGQSGVEAINELPYDGDEQEWEYLCTHTYEKQGIYTVTINGRNYFAFNASITFGGYTEERQYNLICGCMTAELPIAPHIVNYSSFAVGALRLFEVNAKNFAWNSAPVNWHGAFAVCKNLKRLAGFDVVAKYYGARTVTNLCSNCTALVESDFCLPGFVTEINAFGTAYGRCYKLGSTGVTKIQNLIPKTGFATRKIQFSGVFNDCYELGGTVPAGVLWLDTSVKWEQTTQAFQDCTLIAAQVPVSWGGTVADPEIVQHTEVVDVLPDSPDANTVYLVKGQ